MSTVCLGLDVGGTKCAAVIGTDAGRVLARREWEAGASRGPEAMIADLVANARRLLGSHGRGVARVGVAVGGPLDAARGVVLGPPNLPGWNEVRLGERLAEALGLPVVVEHDASASALAEWRWGAPEATRLVYLTCGTGFGMGFVVDGAVYRGAGGRASDIGHLRFREDGPVAYGKRGSLEAFASGGALTKVAQWRFPSRWSDDPPSGREIARLASEGDGDAREVLSLNALAVGRACALLMDVLYPDRISLGSLAAYLGAPWLEEVRSACAAEAMPAAYAACVVAPAALGERVQDLGAVAAAVRQD